MPQKKTTAPPAQQTQEGSGQERILTGTWSGSFVKWLAIAMSLFQLYTGFTGELPGAKQLSVHLFFALMLCFLSFSGSKKTRPDSLPIHDVILAVAAGLAALYMLLNYQHIAYSVGRAEFYDLLIGGGLILLVLEATRRSISPILPIITIVFLVYAYVGPYIPGELAHRGFGVSRIIDHIFMTGEGLWGVPLRVSATFVFLFVLFGSFLEKMGAGEYLIDLSFASMGRFRGGPAKAAVVASGAMGSISGSSIANTVTTGSMTIPLMKKVGFKPHTAGAVEVAASTNGQLMPPIMGAAAFIMAEMLGISYFKIVKAAIIPALLSYTAIFSIVHLEAIKENIRGLTKEETPPLWQTFFSGLHYLIPLFVLIWLLLVWFWTPTTSATWSILAAVIVIAGNNLYRHFVAFPRGKGKHIEVTDLAHEAYRQKPNAFFLYRSRDELLGSLEAGARNMAGIASACACCGIIIGVVTLTGLGLKMAVLISAAAGNSLFLSLLFSVFACIILGLGLPTTATYIIMAAMTAPAIMTISQNLGLELPIIAVHLFVFYYGIVADDTPPVGLCAYAAAGIAGSDPVKTGYKSFRLDLAAFTLPFMFIYNPKLLMLNTNFSELALIIPMCILGMFCWSIFIQGYWLVKTFIWERFLFLGLAFVLVSPGDLTIANIQVPHFLTNVSAVALLIFFYFLQRARRFRQSRVSNALKEAAV
ncbi:MAG: TRAP transporter permease [Desulfohalobiaceae bacterium]|nr:TRAP transporter permease [Desulfohalobiaceae bacterium]